MKLNLRSWKTAAVLLVVITAGVAVLASGTTAGDDRPRGRPRACGVPATARAAATTVARRRPGMTVGAWIYSHMVLFHRNINWVYLKLPRKITRLHLATAILVFDELLWVACG